MKALTLHQPWASLVALGAKTIETRSWSTTYRGPLAIHAAKTTAGFDLLLGDCDGTIEGGWRYGYIGDWQAGYCFQTSDEGQRGDTFLVRLDGEWCELRPSLGAVVATCDLVDVLPIVGPGDLVDLSRPYVAWWTGAEPGAPDSSLHIWGEDEVEETITAQAPYGDYTPGRFAWLLENIEPVDPPAPARGRQQIWEWAA